MKIQIRVAFFLFFLATTVHASRGGYFDGDVQDGRVVDFHLNFYSGGKISFALGTSGSVESYVKRIRTRSTEGQLEITLADGSRLVRNTKPYRSADDQGEYHMELANGGRIDLNVDRQFDRVMTDELSQMPNEGFGGTIQE